MTEASYEAAQKGMPLDDVTPVWRISDLSQPMLRKLSFDPDFLLDRRPQEGLPRRYGTQTVPGPMNSESLPVGEAAAFGAAASLSIILSRSKLPVSTF